MQIVVPERIACEVNDNKVQRQLQRLGLRWQQLGETMEEILQISKADLTMQVVVGANANFGAVEIRRSKFVSIFVFRKLT